MDNLLRCRPPLCGSLHLAHFAKDVLASLDHGINATVEER